MKGKDEKPIAERLADAIKTAGCTVMSIPLQTAFHPRVPVRVFANAPAPSFAVTD